MSTRIHPKNVHENSPKKRTSLGQKCQQDFTKSVHEMSPLLSTRSHLLCPWDVCHPKSRHYCYSFMKIRKSNKTTKIFRPQGADRGAITEPKEEGSGPLATKNRWWKIFWTFDRFIWQLAAEKRWLWLHAFEICNRSSRSRQIPDWIGFSD